MKMQNKTKENDVNTLVKYDTPWPCLNILPNCDHTKIMCPNCAHQTGMLYSFTQAFCAVEIFYTQNGSFVTKLNSRENNF